MNFTSLFNQQMYIECVLYAKHGANSNVYNKEQVKCFSVPIVLQFSVDTDINNI